MWMIGSEGAYLRMVVRYDFKAFGGSFTQMSGKTLHGIALFGILMKLIHDIGQKAAAGGEHAIGHVSNKLFVRFGKMPGNFFESCS